MSTTDLRSGSRFQNSSRTWFRIRPVHGEGRAAVANENTRPQRSIELMAKSINNLEKYKAKRNFTKTQEPKPIVKKGKGHGYLIQKHAASHLHYDFRLELDGVLKSWAVPKGPSLDPHDKRLAMQVEDHPVDYGSFEGVIPQGEYGGGTVMLWDKGTWEPAGDPGQGLAKGKLVFTLHGEKLHGEWTQSAPTFVFRAVRCTLSDC